jgi:hypothetical protein
VNFDGNRLLEFDTDKIGESAASIDAQNFGLDKLVLPLILG